MNLLKPALALLVAAAASRAASAGVTARVTRAASEVAIEFERDGVTGGGFELEEVMAPLAVAGDRALEGGLVTLYLHGGEPGGVAPLRTEAAGVHAVPERITVIERPPGGELAPPAEPPAEPPAPGEWAFWGESARVRGVAYRALHVRLERVAPGGFAAEGWRTLAVRLEAGSAAGAADLARRLRPAPPPFAEAAAAGARGQAGAVPGPDPRAYVPGFLLRIAETGVHAATVADLAAAGWAGGAVPTGEVSLTRHGVQVPVWFRGGEDGRLDRPDDAILFYAEPERSPFASTTTCWLSFAAGPGLALASRSVRPAPGAPGEASLTVRAEEDREYWIALPDGAGRDHWFWNRLRAGELFPGSPFMVPLTLAQAPAGAGRLRLDLQGKSTGSHDLRVSVNFGASREIRWSGAVPWQAEIDLPAELLFSGTNRIDLALAGAGPLDLLYLDRLELAYEGELALADGALAFAGGEAPRGFTLSGLAGGELTLLDVTDPLAPVALAGAEILTGSASFTDSLAGRAYFAATPAGGRAPVAIGAQMPPPVLSLTGADYLVLAPREWVEAVSLLAAHHRARGMAVEFVTPEEAYAAFGYGEPTPAALRALLAHAYSTWSPAPRYVLLVGDATYDHRNLLGGAPSPALPTLPVDAPGLGEIGSDNALADVEGDDGIPEFAIGRITGRSAAEIGAAVAKTVAYAGIAAAPAGEPWLRRLHFIADDGSALNPFERAADELASAVQPAYTIERSYLSAIGSAGAARAVVRQRLEAGSLVALYVGHGNVTTWAVERLFHVEDADRLANGPRTPVVVALNCLNGYFTDAEAPAALAEAFLRRAGGGAVGVWAPAGLGYLADEKALARGFMVDLFGGGQRAIGDVILAAKARHATYPGLGSSRELLEGYTWFGDPALEAALPSPRAPARPAARATAAGVWLAWDEPLAMHVWRAAAGEDSLLVATVPAGERGWVDATAVSGTIYRYALAAEDAAGFLSPLSPWVEVRAGELHGDGVPPAIAVDLPAECADGSAPLAAAITDPDGVVCASLAVELDGAPLPAGAWSADCTAGEVAAAVALTIPPVWGAGEHVLRVAAEDGAGAAAAREVRVVVCAPLRALAVRLGPNPARGAVAIDASFNRPVRLEAEVVSALGRLVRRMNGGVATAHLLVWDGRDRNGRPAAAGIYVVRLRATAGGESWVEERKAVLLR